MSDTNKLHAIDVKNEVKRIKKLPPEQREEQYKALHKRVSDEIDLTCERLNKGQPYMGVEQRRLLYCVLAFPKEYRNSIYEIYEKAFSKVLISKDSDEVSNLEKVKTAHVSGLPLPEQAKVVVWWQNNELVFASSATEFTLPMERIMGMGTTTEFTSSDLGGRKTYLTIEYKKDDEIKSIVVWVTYKAQVRLLIRYFDQTKGARETNRQEL